MCIPFRFILIPALCFLFVAESVAQFEAHFTQYWDLKGYYNPAWAGQNEKVNITGTYSMQLLGFKRAPKSMYFGMDMPFMFLNKKHGAGLSFFNEAIGLFRNQNAGIQYSFKTNIKKGKLAAGVQFGNVSVSFDPTHINLGDEEDDEAFPDTKESGSSLDLGVGIFYSHPKYYLGVSGQHLTAPRISLGEKSEFKIDPVVYLTGGYNIQTRNPLISIQPSFQFQSDFDATRLDLAARLFYTYNDLILNGGVVYSYDTSAAICIGATIKGITVGYAYEYFTSKISAANGSHDLLISYSTTINFSKKNKNKHKSIRIL